MEGCAGIDEHERALLVRACKTLDTIEELEAIVAREGVLADCSQGRRAHPALTECRQQELKLARLMRVLKLEFGEQVARPVVERRPGVRVVGGGA
jgi:hypothetical protein